jgi:hypothetical protein
MSFFCRVIGSKARSRGVDLGWPGRGRRMASGMGVYHTRQEAGNVAIGTVTKLVQAIDRGSRRLDRQAALGELGDRLNVVAVEIKADPATGRQPGRPRRRPPLRPT